MGVNEIKALFCEYKIFTKKCDQAGGRTQDFPVNSRML